MGGEESSQEYGRNVGCCTSAAGSSGRTHDPVCVNWPAGVCKTCLLRHAKDYPCIVAV